MNGHKTTRMTDDVTKAGTSGGTIESIPASASRLGSSRSGEPADARTRLRRRLRDFWDCQEEYWDLLTEEIAATSPNRLRAATFVPQGSRILDIACGRAANSVLLDSKGQYFGTDISLRGMRGARRPGLRLACADAENLPFADASFDAIFCTYALEHSTNPVQMLREMARVVGPRGRVVLLGPTWDFPFWFPNAVRSRAQEFRWRCRYTARRLVGQLRAVFWGRLPFFIVEEPDAFSLPFICDSDAVYVVWSHEVILQMKRFGCRLVHWEVDSQLLGASGFVRALKRLLMVLPIYRRAGSTAVMVFEKK
jgi:SAM-dependent methyltransferase